MILTPTETTVLEEAVGIGEPEEDEDIEENEQNEEEINNNTSSSNSKNRARTHVITRSRSTSDLYVCDLDGEPNEAERTTDNINQEEPERVQSNPGPDNQKHKLTSTPSLNSIRDGRLTGLRSTVPMNYERYSRISEKEDDPYHNLLTASAEKVLNKLKSRQQLMLNQERTHVPKSSPRPFYASNVPRKLKPLFSEEDMKPEEDTEFNN